MYAGCDGGKWMRNTASGLLIVALNTTELNGNGRLQLTHTQKKSLSLLSSHSTSMPLASAGVHRNLKQFKHSSWTWQPYIHRGASNNAKESKSGQHLHFFSVNWWSKHDFPTPMSPVERETENRERHGERLGSTTEMTQEQPFAIQACSIAQMHDVAALLGQSASTMLQISCGAVRVGRQLAIHVYNHLNTHQL